MKEQSQPSQQYLRLNAAHSQIIEQLAQTKAHFHLADHDFPEINLQLGEKILSSSKVNELFVEAAVVAQDHISTLQAINQQTKQILTRLKGFYTLLVEDPADPAVRNLLQKSFTESLSQFDFLIHIVIAIAQFGAQHVTASASEGTTLLTDQSLEKTPALPANQSPEAGLNTELLSQLKTQYQDFEQTFNLFSEYLDKSTQILKRP
jgi:hypothetical protein